MIFQLSEKHINGIMEILKAEHQFWSCDKEGLIETVKTLRKTVGKLPKRIFLHPVKVTFFNIPKDYYLAFAWFLEWLLENPQNHDEMEKAANMMIFSALDELMERGEILAIKYYEIIAQILSGKITKESDFFF